VGSAMGIDTKSDMGDFMGIEPTAAWETLWE
jgi:hypothetical protein